MPLLNLRNPAIQPELGWTPAGFDRSPALALGAQRAQYVYPPNPWFVDDRLLTLAQTNLPHRTQQQSTSIIITHPAYSFKEQL